MKPGKRRPRVTANAVVPIRTIRIGFAPEAAVSFRRLSAKEQGGLRRKLRDFGTSPALGKPLTDELRGYHRITFGRLRTITLRVAETTSDVVVYVLYIGLRRQGAKDDPYEVATAAIRRGDPSAVEVMEQLIQHMLTGELAENQDRLS